MPRAARNDARAPAWAGAGRRGAGLGGGRGGRRPVLCAGGAQGRREGSAAGGARAGTLFVDRVWNERKRSRQRHSSWQGRASRGRASQRCAGAALNGQARAEPAPRRAVRREPAAGGPHESWHGKAGSRNSAARAHEPGAKGA